MKTNNNGRECPSWCAEDHQGEGSIWCESAHYGPTGSHADLEQRDYKDTPELWAWVVGNNRAGVHTASRFYADTAREANKLAEALDIIAGMRKPEIRALAANVRKATAEAWPEAEEAQAG